MNEDKLTGSAQQAGGEMKAEAARAARDHGLRAEGMADQAAGAAREALGEVKNVAEEAWEGTRQAARRAADWVGERAGRPMDAAEVRDALGDMATSTARFVRDRPLTALAIMAALAYIMGRNSRDAYRRRGIWR